MAVELADLALHVDGKQPGDLKPRERADLDGLLSWSTALVDRYIGTSTVPDAVRDAAILRLGYYDYHVRLARKPADGGMLDARFRRDAPLAPLRASGAMALLSPWKHRRAAS